MTAAHEILTQNLSALERAQPELARRLALPTGSDHVDPGPPARYLHNKGWLPLALDDLGPAPGLDAAAKVGDGEVLVLGAGTGDLVLAALAAAPRARVTVWERDPWLLRTALSTRDLTGRIAAGALRFALSSDIATLDIGAKRWEARVEHPLLARIYRRDIAFAESAGDGRPRAALAVGGLLFDSLAEALGRAGYAVWPLEIRRSGIEELDHQMATLTPELLVAVNYTNGLAELAARQGARLLCWEIDPTTTPPRLDPAVDGGAAASVFTWRAREVETFRAAGFQHVRHLPIGADIDLRAPIELSAEERTRYAAPLSYVGASLMRNAAPFRARFLEHWESAGGARTEGERLMGEVLAEQRADPSRFRIPDLLDERAPNLRSELAKGEEDPALLVGELAAAEKRLTYVANLGRLGIHAWGDAGWEPLAQHGVKYRGPAGHSEELTRIYNASVVNIDIGRLYQNDIVTLRTFDVLACGAFALVEHTDELGTLFEVGREVVSYRTLRELLEKASHYVENPDEAAEIGRRGLAAVRERHTVDLRLAEMLRGADPVPSDG